MSPLTLHKECLHGGIRFAVVWLEPDRRLNCRYAQWSKDRSHIRADGVLGPLGGWSMVVSSSHVWRVIAGGLGDAS
jgi:hypothetical protein